MMTGTEEQDLMKRLSHGEAKLIHRRFQQIGVLALAVIAIGTVFMHTVEKLSWIDSVYFSVVSLTTVGYGDITPQTNAGKLFVVGYLLVGIAIIAALINNAFRNAMAKRAIKLHESAKQNDK